MEKSGVQVLGMWPCPFVNRVLMALRIKSVEYEFVETNPFKDRELLLKTNPVHKKIPVLIHADGPICESLVIVQYIDDQWTNGPSILPSHPYDRALARFWVAYVDEKLIPALHKLREVQGEEGKRTTLEKIYEGLVLLEAAFVSCSKGKGFFGGDHVGYIDIALASQLGWIRVYEATVEAKILDEIRTPHLVGWAHRVCSDSSVKDVMIDPKKLLEFYRKLVAGSAFD